MKNRSEGKYDYGHKQYLKVSIWKQYLSDKTNFLKAMDEWLIPELYGSSTGIQKK